MPLCEMVAVHHLIQVKVNAPQQFGVIIQTCNWATVLEIAINDIFLKKSPLNVLLTSKHLAN